jgi:predicted nicotinamide N-methyase
MIEMKILNVIILFLVINIKSTEDLSYNFTIKNDKSNIEVHKESPDIQKEESKNDKPQGIKENQDSKINKTDILKSNPSMAPILVLGDILKEFAKNMKIKSINKRNNQRRRKHRRKLLKSRKAMDLGMGLGLAAGGAALAGGAAMAMGAASNEEIEQEIGIKETEQGILIVMTTSEADMLRHMASTSEKSKGLIEKGRLLLKNTEARLDVFTETIDNICGNLEAQDKHLRRNLYGEGDEEERRKIKMMKQK